MFLQPGAKFGEMLMIARLDGAQDIDRGNIRAGEGAIVDWDQVRLWNGVETVH